MEARVKRYYVMFVHDSAALLDLPIGMTLSGSSFCYSREFLNLGAARIEFFETTVGPWGPVWYLPKAALGLKGIK